MNLIDNMREAGMLKALPIYGTNEAEGTLLTADGRALVPYGDNCTWVFRGPLEEGSIRYWGSASHAGHIELKAMFVLCEGAWHNIATGSIQRVECTHLS